MSRLLTETANYDEEGSWGRMSEEWPGIKGNQAYNMYIFANCIDTIPYGSYVLMDMTYLRVHADHINQLRVDFKAAGEPSSEESVKRREETGALLKSGNRDSAPKWWK